MAKYELSDAVTLFTAEATTIGNLWTVYVVATFAAAGYGISASPSSVIQAGAVSLGFAAFAFGNWKLLKQALLISRTLQGEIRSTVISNPDIQFKSSIMALAATANPPWISLVIHLFIDACVIVAIWTRVPEAAQLSRSVFGP